MAYQKAFQLLICNICLFIVVCLVLFYQSAGDSDPTDSKLRIFKAWNKCAKEKLSKLDNADTFWNTYTRAIRECEQSSNVAQFNLTELKNKDETKYAIIKDTDEKKTMKFVTLGIGRDIEAEQAFQAEIHKLGQKVDFYGADPITDVNAELYSKIGKYFPFAIGSHAGYESASVLENGKYLNKSVIHVELMYFLIKILKMKNIDHLWLDAEGAEYGLFDIFYNNGPLHQNNITFCQMNLEVHMGDVKRREMFMKFVKTILEEENFGMFKNAYAGHIRLYLFNFGNSECVRKFL